MENVNQDNKNSYNLSVVLKYLQFIAVSALLLYFGKTLLIPLCFGLLVAVITYPMSKWLENRKWPRALATALVLTVVILVFMSLAWLLFYEFRLFLRDVPQIKDRFLEVINDIKNFLSTSLNILPDTQKKLLENISAGLNKNMSGSLSSAVSVTAATLFNLVLIPIYAALFLYNRGTFVKFLHSVVGTEYHAQLNSVLHQSIVSYFKFVKGTFFVYCIVGVLNSLGLLMLGIQHAVLFGMITAFMTIIPYAGIIVSAALPVSVALLTKDSFWYPIGVVIVFTVVQYLEANVIYPRIVGQQLNLNTWAVLVSVFLGSLIWGISGMILFIPFVGILKLISDNIEGWKPLNIILKREAPF